MLSSKRPWTLYPCASFMSMRVNCNHWVVDGRKSCIRWKISPEAEGWTCPEPWPEAKKIKKSWPTSSPCRQKWDSEYWLGWLPAACLEWIGPSPPYYLFVAVPPFFDVFYTYAGCGYAYLCTQCTTEYFVFMHEHSVITWVTFIYHVFFFCFFSFYSVENFPALLAFNWPTVLVVG